jgi:hypothetical protein
MLAVNELEGGAFQDSLGNLISHGKLVLTLNQDATVNTNVMVCSGYDIEIPLDNFGDIITSPAYNVWSNDVLTPSTTFYTAIVYSATGARVWGPAYVRVLSTPSPFGVGVWVP